MPCRCNLQKKGLILYEIGNIGGKASEDIYKKQRYGDDCYIGNSYSFCGKCGDFGYKTLRNGSFCGIDAHMGGSGISDGGEYLLRL